MAESGFMSDFELKRVQDFVDFGEQALAAGDLQDLLDTAVANVARGLDARHAKILKRMDDGNLLVTAGIGWSKGVVGNAVLSGGLNGPPGYALQSGEPVRSNDFTTETRFKVPPLLAEHGIVSAINVIIRGNGTPFGVLEVDSTEVRDFGPRDTAFLQGYAQLLSAAIIRVRQTDEINAKAEENVFLLQELHHRIGNDFQLVTSLIHHRAGQTASAEGKAELSWVSNRIRSLSHLHEQLRKANSSSTIDLGAYLKSLCADLDATHNLESRSILLDVQTERWLIGSTNAVSIGLIVNEFLANSVEHAFANEGGTISVHLSHPPEGPKLCLWDNGRGFDSTAASLRSGLGLMLQLAESVSTRVSSETASGVRLEMHLKPELNEPHMG